MMTETALADVAPIGEVSPQDYPIPAGWRVLIEPIKIEETTQGGIVLPEAAKEAKEHLRHIGRVVDMGELCYKHGKFQGCEPWCKVGDYVAYGAYSGQEMKVRNSKGTDYVALRLINDDEVLAVIPSPTSVMIYC
jgi:co-chaperonin GroES (HSP10)